MPIDMFEARSLTNGIQKVKTVDPFMINLLFKGQDRYHATDMFDLEITTTLDKLAQFVAAGQDPRRIKKGKKTVKTVRIPQTWEKKPFTAAELAAYKTAGNMYIAAAEREARSNQFVLRELEDLKQRILRRREQLACEAISTGKITVSQDNIAFTIDFDFVATTHLITNATAAKWTAATPDPTIVNQLRAWKSAIVSRTGVSPDTVILGADAAKSFVSSEEVRKLLDTNNLRIGQLQLNNASFKYGNFLGTLLGMDFFEYNQTYIATDGSDTVTDMIAKDRCIMLNSGGDFEMHHGPLYRIEGQGLKVHQVDMLVEPKTNDDKTYLEWKVDQKSLPAVHDPDNVISVDVQ